MSFRPKVWAPFASSLELIADGQRSPMTRSGTWWNSELELPAGTDYSYSVNGGKAIPDPRSAWQPQGVHGPSRVMDHSRFVWTDRQWQPKPLPSGVIYELHTGTFTPEGTFDAIAGKLDHLLELGVTHVELMPVAEFSGDWGWGYDGVDLYAPHHVYGDPNSLKRLVNTCHDRGLAVLLDVVYNHFGPSGNYLSQFGPYTADRHHTPWGAAVNLDGPESVEVRRYFIDNALMWLRDYHFDGLRLDAVHALMDNSAYHLLEQLGDEVRALERQLQRYLVVIAESDLNDPRIVRPTSLGGYGMDAQWSDDFHHALHSVLTGEVSGYYVDFGQISDLAKAIRHAFVYDGCYSTHRRRRHGRTPEGIPAYRFVVSAQNHDQVGNRAAGDRMSHLVNPARQKIAAAMTLLSPFIPMLFQGEEWGASTPFQYFTHHPEEWLATAVSEGRRSEFRAFGWKPEDVPDPQDFETFERSKLNWSEAGEPSHAEMLQWYRDLIRLRRRFAHALVLESPRIAFDEAQQWLSVSYGAVTVAFSLCDHTVEIPVFAGGQVVLQSGKCGYAGETLRLGPESLAILGPR